MARSESDDPRPPLSEAISRVVVDTADEPPRRFGPHGKRSSGSPPDRFVQVPEVVREWLQQLRTDDVYQLGEAMAFYGRLPPKTREWIRELRPEDVEEIRNAMEFARSARTIGRFGRWALITMVAMFTAAITFGEKAAIAWKWFTGGAR